MPPTVEEEQTLRAAGYTHVAGLDEVGRGCWAGPVVAAAVLLSDAVIAQPSLLAGVDDSKALRSAQRDNLYGQITAVSVYAVGIVSAYIIDTHGILNATRLAMHIALLSLPVLPDVLLIDAVELHGWPCPQRALIKGDARCLSIAAASIVAKVTRDRLMTALGAHLPRYGFAAHKGYGTVAHQYALHTHGVTIHHRRSFRPISRLLANYEQENPT
ncbi:MAG: ribonuclease HII [Roseiflexaceae bacterium]|nr:ribonuclease HII [Roseiflexaceae bacterium]